MPTRFLLAKIYICIWSSTKLIPYIHCSNHGIKANSLRARRAAVLRAPSKIVSRIKKLNSVDEGHFVEFIAYIIQSHDTSKGRRQPFRVSLLTTGGDASCRARDVQDPLDRQQKLLLVNPGSSGQVARITEKKMDRRSAASQSPEAYHVMPMYVKIFTECPKLFL